MSRRINASKQYISTRSCIYIQQYPPDISIYIYIVYLVFITHVTVTLPLGWWSVALSKLSINLVVAQ